MEDEMENGILGSIDAQAERWPRIGMPTGPRVFNDQDPKVDSRAGQRVVSKVGRSRCRSK